MKKIFLSFVLLLFLGVVCGEKTGIFSDVEAARRPQFKTPKITTYKAKVPKYKTTTRTYSQEVFRKFSSSESESENEKFVLSVFLERSISPRSLGANENLYTLSMWLRHKNLEELFEKDFKKQLPKFVEYQISDGEINQLPIKSTGLSSKQDSFRIEIKSKEVKKHLLGITPEDTLTFWIINESDQSRIEFKISNETVKEWIAIRDFELTKEERIKMRANEKTKQETLQKWKKRTEEENKLGTELKKDPELETESETESEKGNNSNDE